MIHSFRILDDWFQTKPINVNIQRDMWNDIFMLEDPYRQQSKNVFNVNKISFGCFFCNHWLCLSHKCIWNDIFEAFYFLIIFEFIKSAEESIRKLISLQKVLCFEWYNEWRQNCSFYSLFRTIFKHFISIFLPNMFQLYWRHYMYINISMCLHPWLLRTQKRNKLKIEYVKWK